MDASLMPYSSRITTMSRLLGAALAVSLILGCRDVPEERPTRFEDVPFTSAVAGGQIERTRVSIGPETRPVLVGGRGAAGHSLVFESDPIAIQEVSAIEGAIAMKARDPDADARVRRVFRIDARGPAGQRTLLERGTEDAVKPDQWTEYRVALPADLGSPLTLHFEATPSPQQSGQANRARTYFTSPRIVRSASEKRANVLLVVFDTLRADRTQPYGYTRETTPFLAELAKRGTRVRDFVATYSSTLTTHWSMFTGLFPARHGVYPGKGIRKYEGATLANEFHAAGYTTAAFTEGGYVHSLFGFDKGFDRYHNGPATKIEDQRGAAPETFALARDWLMTREKEPWFLFLHTYQVHGPYAPPAEYRAMFANDHKGRWHDVFPVLSTFTVNNGKTQVSDVELASISNLYDAEIRQLDDLFAQLWQTLDEAGRLDNTIVVITSDHGEDLMEHGWLQHGTTLYDPALRVPFLVVAPGRVAEGATLACQRPQPDLMPTVLELAGLEVPEGLDGRSLAPSLESGSCDGDRPAFSELLEPTYRRHADLPLVSLRGDDWKLIRHLNTGQIERYRLDRDPGETHNLTGSNDTRSLEAELDQYIKSRPAGLDGGVEPISAEVRARLEALGYLP